MSNNVSEYIEISEDDFFEKYKPITNHLNDNAPFTYNDKGLMFETYGEELEFVRTQPDNKIWTYQDDDMGNPIIANGYHLVNRIGYFITENPFPDNMEIVVNLD